MANNRKCTIIMYLCVVIIITITYIYVNCVIVDVPSAWAASFATIVVHRVYTASVVVNEWGADTVSKWFRVGEKADRLFPDVGPFSLSSCRGGSSLCTAYLSTYYIYSATINFFGFLYCNFRFIVSRDLFLRTFSFVMHHFNHTSYSSIMIPVTTMYSNMCLYNEGKLDKF